MVEIPRYVFPVLANGEIITDIEIRLKDGQWKVGAIGGKLNKRVYEVAEANKIDINQCKVVKCPLEKIIIAEIDGEEKAINYSGERKPLIMNSSYLDKSKEYLENLKKLSEKNTEEEISPEDVFLSNGTSSLLESFKQEDNIPKRLLEFIYYHV